MNTASELIKNVQDSPTKQIDPKLKRSVTRLIRSEQAKLLKVEYDGVELTSDVGSLKRLRTQVFSSQQYNSTSTEFKSARYNALIAASMLLRHGGQLEVGPQRHQRGPSGTEFEQQQKRRGGGVESAGSAGLAGFSSHLHRQHAQEPQGALKAGRLRRVGVQADSDKSESDLALMGHPNAFPSVSKATASDWTIMQSCV